MHLSRKEYIASLAKKFIAAGAIIFDEDGRILLVKPNYRDYWSIPGGVSDEGESPRQTCEREVFEEIGLKLTCDKLLLVDHLFLKSEQEDSLKFFFYGGVLAPAQIKAIKLQKSELDDFAFRSVGEASELVNTRMAERLPKFLDSIKSGTTILTD